MHSLEARVHGLELALDEISFDLALSTGRVSQNGGAGAICCKLPGTDFLSSKLWRKAGAHSSTSRPPASGGTLSAARTSDNIGDDKRLSLENQRYLVCRRLIVNPLAKISSGSLGFPDVSSSGAVNRGAA